MRLLCVALLVAAAAAGCLADTDPRRPLPPRHPLEYSTPPATLGAGDCFLGVCVAPADDPDAAALRDGYHARRLVEGTQVDSRSPFEADGGWLVWQEPRHRLLDRGVTFSQTLWSHALAGGGTDALAVNNRSMSAFGGSDAGAILFTERVPAKDARPMAWHPGREAPMRLALFPTLSMSALDADGDWTLVNVESAGDAQGLWAWRPGDGKGVHLVRFSLYNETASGDRQKLVGSRLHGGSAYFVLERTDFPNTTSVLHAVNLTDLRETLHTLKGPVRSLAVGPRFAAWLSDDGGEPAVWALDRTTRAVKKFSEAAHDCSDPEIAGDWLTFRCFAAPGEWHKLEAVHLPSGTRLLVGDDRLDPIVSAIDGERLLFAADLKDPPGTANPWQRPGKGIFSIDLPPTDGRTRRVPA